MERLIQQVLASPELQIRLPELPIDKAYMNSDFESYLRHYKVTQQEAKESLSQLKTDLMAFLDKRLQELPNPPQAGSAGLVSPWDDNDSALLPIKPESNSQEQKKWWEFWKR